MDLNVPLDKSDEVTVTDDTRLRAIVPTAKFLLDKSAKLILCSHFGRPKGEIIEKGKVGQSEDGRLERAAASDANCMIEGQ